jgi:hypothetical protein
MLCRKIRSAISEGLVLSIMQHVTVSSEVLLVVTIVNCGGGNDRDNGARDGRKHSLETN